jgi:type I restriction enzyme M protein
MPRNAGTRKTTATAASAPLGYEAELWRMADALRGSMDAAEYKHVVLGLIFLKYISDAFEEKHAALRAEKAQGADPEDPDEYRAQSIFWVPPEARWSYLKSQARQPIIGRLVDDAMAGGVVAEDPTPLNQTGAHKSRCDLIAIEKGNHSGNPIRT